MFDQDPLHERDTEHERNRDENDHDPHRQRHERVEDLLIGHDSRPVGRGGVVFPCRHPLTVCRMTVGRRA